MIQVEDLCLALQAFVAHVSFEMVGKRKPLIIKRRNPLITFQKPMQHIT
jgi:hypothetical protein